MLNSLKESDLIFLLYLSWCLFYSTAAETIFAVSIFCLFLNLAVVNWRKCLIVFHIFLKVDGSKECFIVYLWAA